ncbi:MAG: cell division protein FtsL [Spirochaetaceae bacterium]|nr:cell division protein FtsL [Spirochaetaceae bacterium]
MSNGKKILIAFLVITVPVLLFLNAWQGFRYERISAEIRNHEHEQIEWFEENKKMLATITVYSSPARVRQIIEENSDLRLKRPGQAIIIQFSAEEGR